VIDPAKVVAHGAPGCRIDRGAAGHHEALVAEKPKKESPPAMPPGMGGAAWTSEQRRGPEDLSSGLHRLLVCVEVFRERTSS